ncbi:MAG: hypothetical protein ACYDEO_26475, partial [Aggregatilineales bacterium]
MSGNREGLTLDEIEGLALEIGAKAEQGISQALVEEGSRPAGPGSGCANCGQEMHYKGQKGRYVETRSGTVRVERAYYYCEQCRRGFFSLDERLGLIEGGLSNGLAQDMVWLSGQMTYEQASQVLRQIGGLEVPTSTVWEQMQRHGERLLRAASHEQAHVSVERTEWEQPRYDPTVRKGVSMDGGLVNIRGEGSLNSKSVSSAR